MNSPHLNFRTRFVVTTGYDQKITLWHPETGQEAGHIELVKKSATKPLNPQRVEQVAEELVAVTFGERHHPVVVDLSPLLRLIEDGSEISPDGWPKIPVSVTPVFSSHPDYDPAPGGGIAHPDRQRKVAACRCLVMCHRVGHVFFGGYDGRIRSWDMQFPFDFSPVEWPLPDRPRSPHSDHYCEMVLLENSMPNCLATKALRSQPIGIWDIGKMRWIRELEHTSAGGERILPCLAGNDALGVLYTTTGSDLVTYDPRSSNSAQVHQQAVPRPARHLIARPRANQLVLVEKSGGILGLDCRMESSPLFWVERAHKTGYTKFGCNILTGLTGSEKSFFMTVSGDRMVKAWNGFGVENWHATHGKYMYGVCPLVTPFAALIGGTDQDECMERIQFFMELSRSLLLLSFPHIQLSIPHCFKGV